MYQGRWSMKKVIVIGNCGSGKSTFSVALAKATNLPLIHLDKLGWHGNFERVSKHEFDKMLCDELNKERWIIDGNYNRTIQQRLEKCDTVFYFDLPVIVCLLSVIKRYFKYRKNARPDMADNCKDKIDLRFYWFILTYKSKHGKRIEKMLNNSKSNGIEIIIFKSRKEVNKYINDIG